MSTIKSKKVQLGTDANSANNFTLYQPATPDGTLRIGVGNADSPTEIGQFNANGYKPAANTVPVVAAYMSANQSISAATFTKLNFDTTLFDTTSDFDTTNNRFVPSVAGYYQVNGTVLIDPAGRGIFRLYKNGSVYINFNDIDATTPRNLVGTAIVYMNGTTDYLELYVYRATTGNAYGVDGKNTQLSAHLIQQA